MPQLIVIILVLIIAYFVIVYLVIPLVVTLGAAGAVSGRGAFTAELRCRPLRASGP